MSKKPSIVKEVACVALILAVLVPALQSAFLEIWPSPHTVQDEWSSLGTVTARFSQPFVVTHMIMAGVSIAAAAACWVGVVVLAVGTRHKSIFGRAARVLGALAVFLPTVLSVSLAGEVRRAEATLTPSELRIVDGRSDGWIPDRQEIVYAFEHIDVITLTTTDGKASSLRFRFTDGRTATEPVESNFGEIWPLLERVGFLPEADVKEQEREAAFERWQQQAAERQAQERELKARELEAALKRWRPIGGK